MRTSMRAAVCDGDGGRLRLETRATPALGPGRALIAVEACGLNFADTLMRAGTYQEKPTPPFAPGVEVAGVVLALGEGTAPEGVAVGVRVAAVVGHGGLAEIASAPLAGLAPLPESVDATIAAATPVAYGTSHMALGYKAGLRPGERLLVLGAAGGVGLAAVEIGALMGAEVVAVARGAEKRALVARKGAHTVIDSDEVTEPGALAARLKAMGGVDVVYDPVGGALFDDALRATRFEGRLVPIGFASGVAPKIPANLLLVKNLTAIGFAWGAYVAKKPAPLAASLREVLAMVAAGRLAPHVSEVAPLEQADAALDRIAARGAVGKIVVRPGA